MKNVLAFIFGLLLAALPAGTAGYVFYDIGYSTGYVDGRVYELQKDFEE